MEIWKDIIGYESFYQVSNIGRVRSLDRTVIRDGYGSVLFKGQIMNQFENNGYMMVTLRKDGHKHNYKVHRLVMMAFEPNPDNLPCINHKDNNRKNNVVSNLEWCTYKYNNDYRFINKAS